MSNLNRLQFIPLRSLLLLVLTSTSLTYSCMYNPKQISKRQHAIWRLECELGVISKPDCPVDGGWSPWSPWTPCRGPCDNIGRRRRTRQCINPPPTEDGLPCAGPDEEQETCYLTNCSVEDFRKLIKGDSNRREAFQQLEAVPAIMERCLQMECPYEAIEAALSSDNTWQLNPETLWNSLQCVKHDIGCPVTGEWGAWGAWSACGARCGFGLRWRLRRCDTPPPSEAHLVCSGTPLQSEECEGNQCAVDVRDIERDAGGPWSDWGQWTKCSERCGIGVRRRRRICLEQTLFRSVGTWGTHCGGQHDQLEICEFKKCKLDGGWSGWSVWGPCSQSCGAGKKSRTRSCTRPKPAGGGAQCVGPRSETESCYTKPCEIHSHVVAFLNGESYLQYNFKEKRSTFFHFFVRFMPLSPHGTLVRRAMAESSHVTLSLHKRHVCLDAGGLSRSCNLRRICSSESLELAVWHSALITVTSEAATLRMDDTSTSIRGTFPCDPEWPNELVNIFVGEKLNGEIQDIVLNFIPLDIIIDKDIRTKKSSFIPSSASNIAYDKANIEEAYVTLSNDQYIRLPCFSDQEEWRLQLTLKSKRDDGTIILLKNDASDSWLHLCLQNMRLKLEIAFEDFRSEIASITECPPDQWLDVTVSKKRQSNTIEASINSGERLHVMLEDTSRRRRESKKNKLNHLHDTGLISSLINNHSCDGAKVKDSSYKPRPLEICSEEFYVGGIPEDIKPQIQDEIVSFSGIIAVISINNVLQDLHDFSVERFKDGKLQLSSKTASVSGSYHETAWGQSNRLNLTCLHARTVRSPHSAYWLYLDTGITGAVRDKTVRSMDDGRVLRLVASADNDLRGFYTCRAHTHKGTRNIVTYGVLGQVRHNLTGPDGITALAVLTTLTLVACTISWLIIEGVYDLRNGFGFFRDPHLSPQEEAEAVCNYIDEHIHLIGSKSVAKLAKARARRKGRRLASRASFAAQEPQGLLQIDVHSPIRSEPSSSSEPEGLPALPEMIGSSKDATHEVYRCEPSYISSPLHGSIVTSPRTGLTSSSMDISSPRFLCSRLLMAKRIYSSREKLFSRKKKCDHSSSFKNPCTMRSNLATIKSSRCINLSPGQKVLEKFQRLQNED